MFNRRTKRGLFAAAAGGTKTLPRLLVFFSKDESLSPARGAGIPGDLPGFFLGGRKAALGASPGAPAAPLPQQHRAHRAPLTSIFNHSLAVQDPPSRGDAAGGRREVFSGSFWGYSPPAGAGLGHSGMSLC